MNPSTKKVRFGRILRELRLRKGIGSRELSRLSRIHQSYISKFENGALDPNKDHLAKIAEALSLSISERNRLLSWHKLLDQDFSPFVSRQQVAEGQNIVKQLEESAVLIRTFQLAVIPGLLQTEEYMKAIFATERYSDRATSTADIRKAISGRLERQLIFKDASKRVSFVVHESALQNRIASEHVMLKQIQHLQNVASEGEINLGIIPANREWKGELLLNSFHTYDEEFVLVELYGGVLYLYDEGTVGAYYRFFDKIQVNASYGQKCVDLLERVKVYYK